MNIKTGVAFMQNSTTEMGTEIAKKSNTALEWCGYINIIATYWWTQVKHTYNSDKIIHIIHWYVLIPLPLACTMLRLELQLTSGVIRAIHGRMFEIAPGGTKWERLFSFADYDWGCPKSCIFLWLVIILSQTNCLLQVITTPWKIWH